MPYCRNCGKEIRDASKFCDSCGAEQKHFEEKESLKVSSDPRSEKPVFETYGDDPFKRRTILFIIFIIALVFMFIYATFSTEARIAAAYDMFETESSKMYSALRIFSVVGSIFFISEIILAQKNKNHHLVVTEKSVYGTGASGFQAMDFNIEYKDITAIRTFHQPFAEMHQLMIYSRIGTFTCFVGDVSSAERAINKCISKQ